MREVSSVKLAKFLLKLPEVDVQNVEQTLINMGIGLKPSQVREIQTHIEIGLKQKADQGSSQVSVKTEPDAEIAPPTPKISRKVCLFHCLYNFPQPFVLESTNCKITDGRLDSIASKIDAFRSKQTKCLPKNPVGIQSC